MMNSIRGRIAIFAAALMAVGVLGWMAQPSTAQACDACNNAFQNELENERSDTLLGSDYRQAKENHSKFSVLNFGGDSEQPQPVAQAGDTEQQQPIMADTSSAQVGPVAQAGTGPTTASVVNPNPHNRNFEEIFADEQFIEIIDRDENLSETPPTGYAPQDAEPDKEFTIELNEGQAYLGQGVMYDGFLIDGKIPGPTLRVQQGDIVRINIENTGTVPHGGSIHAAYTQTSAHIGQIDPGDTHSVTFRATYPGVFMYHCAPGGHAIPAHVMAGQYGMIVVEPEQDYKLEQELGHGPDIEMYILEHEIYATGKDAVEGTPTYTAFNGQPFRYVVDPIAVEPGDYVRIYYLNTGPNLWSTFHFVGIIWDYVYWQGHPEARMPGGQTVTSGPSDSWVIEFRVPPAEGMYTMLNHAVGAASQGAIGLLAAEEGVDGPSEILADGPEFSESELEEKADEAVRTISPFGIGSEELEYPERYGADTDEVVVRMQGNSFEPSVIEIEEGTTVTWINDDVFAFLDGEFSGIHNAVGTDGPEQFSTDMLAHAESDSVTFDTPGEYNYICTPHPYMEGKIIVRPSDEEEEAEATGCSSTNAAPVAPLVMALAVMLGAVALRRIELSRRVVSEVA